MLNGIFPFIGLDPMTQCAKSLGIVNAEGYIDANENMETAVKGVFVAGDVRSKQLRQVVRLQMMVLLLDNTLLH